MNTISHHIPDHMVRAYVAGTLNPAFSLVVATHVSMCDECRSRLESEEAMGGAVLDGLAPKSEIEVDLLASVLDRLDEPAPEEAPNEAMGIYPGPLTTALNGKDPRWRSLGSGIRQMIIHSDEEGSARLLYIPAGKAVPDHGHNGEELTLVLQGSFSDHTGRFARGDVEVADDDIDHTPIAGAEADCICLAATDNPIRFHSLIPRLLQPLFRI